MNNPLRARPPARFGAAIATAHDVDPKVQLAMEMSLNWGFHRDSSGI